MTISRTNAVVLAAGLVLTSFSLVACSSSTTSTSTPSSAPLVASAAPTPDTSVVAAGGTSYCEPLAAAFKIKPASGEPASDAQLAAFGEAMVPAATAAAADGRQDLADMFTLIAKVNSDPNGTTPTETSQALNEVITNADEVKAACGVDMLQ